VFAAALWANAGVAMPINATAAKTASLDLLFMVFLLIGRAERGATLSLPGAQEVRSVTLNLIGRLLKCIFANAE
jgi:hypothetical protein